MKFKLEIDMDNAAFDEPYDELYRILSGLNLESLIFPKDGKWSKFIIESPEKVLDSNGNTVGYMVIEE